MAGYRAQGGQDRDHRTPMAWQHRDHISEGHTHRHREQTPPARHGGYPGPGQGSPTRHSVDREARSPRSPGRYQPEPGLRTPGSRSRSRGHSRDRNSVHGGRANRGYSRSGTSPSSTDNTGTEDTTETDSHTVDTADREGSEYHGQAQHMMPGPGYPMMVGYPMMPQMPQLAHVAPLLMPGTGSIRSVQSVPMLSAAGHMPGHHTWDGEPCPVHHHHQHPMVPLAALYGMPGYAPSMSMAYSVPPSVISGATTVRRARSVAELSQAGPAHAHHHGGHHLEAGDRQRSLHASMASLGHSQVGGGHHPRPGGHHRMVMAENGAPSKLPMRDIGKKVSPVPSKDEKKAGLGCCSGHFVVMWIILGIVTFGVLLGIVLKFTVST